MLKFRPRFVCRVASCGRQFSAENPKKSDNADNPDNKPESVDGPKEKLDKLLRTIKASSGGEEKRNVTLAAQPTQKNFPSSAEKPRKNAKKISPPPEKEILDDETVAVARKAAVEFAKSVKGTEDEKSGVKFTTEAVLLSKLRSITKDTAEARLTSEVSGSDHANMAALVGSLKVEHDKTQAPKVVELTFEQKTFLEERKRKRMKAFAEKTKREYEATNLFGSTDTFGILPRRGEGSKPESSTSEALATWSSCEEREVRILSTAMPRNRIEDMALMTDKGMLWHFPINNEQGIDESEMEPYHEHVFLGHHLEPWCPPDGAVRHFMTVVCVALSKNPYITAAKKVEHIHWFRDYFAKPDPSAILKASGVIES